MTVDSAGTQVSVDHSATAISHLITPITPRRLLSPTRACYAPIVNSFTCACDIKHFSEHIVPKTTFSVSRPLEWLEWRQIRQRPLRRSNQPLLILDVIPLFEFELLISAFHGPLHQLNSSIFPCLFVVCCCPAMVTPDKISDLFNKYRQKSPKLIQYHFITNSTVILLYWPSTIKYWPVPPSTDLVPSYISQFHSILTQYHQVPNSAALYWPSAIIFLYKRLVQH